MKDKNNLIKKGLIPIAKYWSARLGLLDTLNNTSHFIPLVENRKDIGDDLEALIRISKEWNTKKEHNVGEGGAVYRFLQFASWKYGLGKKFIKEGTLLERPVCDNPDIINWPISKLITLDEGISQWGSAAILTGNTEPTKDDYFLNLSKEALAHYNEVHKKGGYCELRYDDTLLYQANAYIDLLKTGHLEFKPRHQDDYCFARAFGIVQKPEGEKRWPELRGHESNRLEEMEKELYNLENRKDIDSRDHRVVQAIAELALAKGIRDLYNDPGCVTKSWPQFWDFMEYAKKVRDRKA